MTWLRDELSKGARVPYWLAAFAVGMVFGIHVIGTLAEALK